MALSLKVENVAAAYGVVSVLHGVSLSVEEGETIALLGTNGNGKSTLLKCVTGLLRTKSGRITLELDGIAHPLERMAPHEIAALGVSMTPEGRRLFPKLTVEENLRLGAYAKTARSRIPENLDFCYQAFPVLRQRRTQIAGTMSGGQQQMLAICRSLMSSPRLLIIDEPSVGLSPLLVSEMISRIEELKASRNLTVLMAEQNFHQASRIADRGYLMVHGQIVLDARTRAELVTNPMIREYYLGG